MSSTLSPRESGEFITGEADHVKIVEKGIKDVAEKVVEQLQSGKLSMSGFSQSELHPKTVNEEAINWIFVVDTLNFCFWSSNSEKRWTVTWKGKPYSGYFALCAAINRALDEGYSITDPKYYSQISLRDMKTIFRGDNNLVSMPLLTKRLDCLHEVGLILLERFDGKFSNCISSCSNSAEKLLKTVVENFPCFRDEALYKNRTVTFYKRAQILIGDIWACFKGRNEGYFKDIDSLTMFADYRVPQVLVHFQALQYDEDLMTKLKAGTLLESGSPEEVEIRGCTLHAVELINKEVRKLQPLVVPMAQEGEPEKAIICNSVLIDHFLWDYRRAHASERLGPHPKLIVAGKLFGFCRFSLREKAVPQNGFSCCPSDMYSVTCNSFETLRFQTRPFLGFRMKESSDGGIRSVETHNILPNERYRIKGPSYQGNPEGSHSQFQFPGKAFEVHALAPKLPSTCWLPEDKVSEDRWTDRVSRAAAVGIFTGIEKTKSS